MISRDYDKAFFKMLSSYVADPLSSRYRRVIDGAIVLRISNTSLASEVLKSHLSYGV